jgi:hypothetical protein
MMGTGDRVARSSALSKAVPSAVKMVKGPKVLLQLYCRRLFLSPHPPPPSPVCEVYGGLREAAAQLEEPLLELDRGGRGFGWRGELKCESGGGKRPEGD